MQAIRAPLPELDLARQDAIAAPVRRPRRRIAVALARVFHRPLECSTVRNALALRRGPGGVASAERACDVIRVRVSSLDPRHRAVDAHLTLQVGPHEHQARRAARFELARLAALVIRIEDEAAALDAFQEHHPGAGCTIGAHGGERHRVGQRQPRAQGIVEPALELPQRIALGSSFREAGAHVFLAQIRDVHTGILRCEIQRPREIRAFSL